MKVLHSSDGELKHTNNTKHGTKMHCNDADIYKMGLKCDAG